MLRCCKCGKPCTVHAVEESRGEFWGFPAYETVHYSDCCNDDVYEEDEDEEKNNDIFMERDRR